jgi:hypothetical protein
MSDKVADKIGGFPNEYNRVKAAAALIDVARGTCGKIGIAN